MSATSGNVSPIILENGKILQNEDNRVLFEDALELTGLGKYNYRLFGMSIVCLLSMVLVTFGVSIVATAGACDLHLTTQTKGIIVAMPMMGMVLSAHLWGWLADTRGRRTVLLASLTGAWISSVGCSLATAWPVFAVFKFFCAFFASACNSVTYALFGECTPRTHRNKLVLMMSSGLMFGQGVMALISYPLLRAEFSYVIPGLDVNYRPWRLLEQVYGLASGLGALLLLFFIKESPKFYASRGREEDSLRVLREIFALNTGKKPEEYTVKGIIFEESVVSEKGKGVLKSLWEQTTPLFRPPLLTKTLIISYIVIVVYVVTPSFMMWMPTIANGFSRSIATGARGHNFCKMLYLEKSAYKLVNSSNSTIEPPCVDKVEDLTFIVLLIFSSCLSVLNTINSFMLRYVNKRSLVIFYHVLSGVCGLTLPWILNNVASLLVFFLFQINLVSMGLTTSFTVELYPTYLRAMSVCLTMMIGRGFSFLAITYTGVLMETHCDATFYVFGVFVLSGALMGIFLPRDQKNEIQK